MTLLRRTFTNFLVLRNITVSCTVRKNEDLSIVLDDANISSAMKVYRKKAEEQKHFMNEKIMEFDIGKRHLANMMGEDVETFTQDDIDNAIAYLLPSGLFQHTARPSMKHPTDIFPKMKEAEFDETGRPFHSLFYTSLPKYYQLLQTISLKAHNLDKAPLKSNSTETGFRYSVVESSTLDLSESHWITQEELKNLTFERITDKNYEFFITSLNRLASHPKAIREEKFIMQYREKDIDVSSKGDIVPEFMYTEMGIAYMTHSLRVRRSFCTATVYSNGSGKISINGDDLTFFDHPQEREQVLFPLQFTGLLNRVDIVATAILSEDAANIPDSMKKMGAAYGIRQCISYALRPFVPNTMIMKMKMAGLLTHDPRRKERKKPGRMRARRRYTWKKR